MKITVNGQSALSGVTPDEYPRDRAARIKSCLLLKAETFGVGFWGEKATRQASRWKPAALLDHKKKKNHPAADAVVINHAHICRKYLLLQPEMQNKSGDLLEGRGGGGGVVWEINISGI